MARLDYKRSPRFNSDWATDRIFHAMEGWRATSGDFLWYWRYSEGTSQMDPVYDEATGVGRQYTGPINVPCQHVTHVPGANEYGEYGMYYNDSIDAVISFDTFTSVGMTMADIENGNYLDDRVLYKRKIYRVVTLAARGQIQQRSIIVSLSGSEMKPDELVDDPQFQIWNQGGADNVLGED